MTASSMAIPARDALPFRLGGPDRELAAVVQQVEDVVVVNLHRRGVHGAGLDPGRLYIAIGESSVIVLAPPVYPY